MNFKDLERLILNDGWFIVSKKGSHNHYKHPIKLRKVTIPSHGKKEIHPDTVRSIKKQAGL